MTKKQRLDDRNNAALPEFFRKNYDYGQGFYQNMDQYKSVSDFLKGKRKKNKKSKARLMVFEGIIKEAQKNKNDSNLLTDHTEEQIQEPIPWNPPESGGAIVGMLDGIYPKEDLEDKPVTNLYYGRIESHYADDKRSEKPKNA